MERVSKASDRVHLRGYILSSDPHSHCYWNYSRQDNSHPTSLRHQPRLDDRCPVVTNSCKLTPLPPPKPQAEQGVEAG